MQNFFIFAPYFCILHFNLLFSSQPSFHSLGMGIEPFSFSYYHSSPAQSPHSRFIQGDDIGNLEEVRNTQRRTETSAASGGQDMAGTGNIIAENDRRVFAYENTAGIANFG